MNAVATTLAEVPSAAIVAMLARHGLPLFGRMAADRSELERRFTLFVRASSPASCIAWTDPATQMRIELNLPA
jgi:hypothetical protein